MEAIWSSRAERDGVQLSKQENPWPGAFAAPCHVPAKLSEVWQIKFISTVFWGYTSSLGCRRHRLSIWESEQRRGQSGRGNALPFHFLRLKTAQGFRIGTSSLIAGSPVRLSTEQGKEFPRPPMILVSPSLQFPTGNRSLATEWTRRIACNSLQLCSLC